ncbi:MAG: hypothetical protein A2722_03490 [Candidatus Doudnabacteria bacterium RIFCSPHIGHO2_01_FULL_50_11]|uniref:Uncharacterized protein n=1 Tax=Candidatus Doudnabacteria bacterium RIFCSPHIGHO2_01_FULL_50_11 TaxID=1817828 RepID=A0A1F5PIH8_9BACT|nr:MAG: hypothetical protein A2722_03490 [Candidatus Doudnabacteria bacterium RIFCSPHIGHO2_01_FULL_50_11]HLC44388.1 hypothetical protein [Patescibacteria group bacterium]
MHVPAWLLLPLVLLAIWSVVITAFHFLWNPLPYPDLGSWIFVAPSKEAQLAVIGMLRNFGHKPRFRADSQDIKRAIYPTGVIINTVLPPIACQLKGRTSGLAIVHPDPPGAAKEAVEYLEREGYEADVWEDPEPSMDKGSFAFVITSALPGTVLVFRKHIAKLGPRPPRWQTVDYARRYSLPGV